MTELIKLTQEQHEFIKTFYIDGRAVDKIDKEKAIYYISRWGWDHALTDGNNKEYSYFSERAGRAKAPFNQNERFKIIDAIINGYKVIEQRYRLYTEPYSEITGNIEKMYFLDSGVRPRTTKADKKLKEDFDKTFSLEEAKKIKGDFERLGVTFELEEV